MSEQDPGEFRAYVRQRSADKPKRSPTSYVVMGIGIAAFAGVVWYAYSQGNRAGTESVAPVLRADLSPTRVRPEQPGGIDVPHQDKLVYERLNPNAREAGVEHILPPPEAPLARPRPAARPAAADADLPEEQPAPAPAVKAEAASPAPPPAAAPKPAPTAAQAAPVMAPPPAQVAAATPAPPAPAAGGVRIQLASVGQEGQAGNEWQRLTRKYPEFFGGAAHRVVAADLGARGTFYRVQAGPFEDARAREICDALKAKGDACILVR